MGTDMEIVPHVTSSKARKSTERSISMGIKSPLPEEEEKKISKHRSSSFFVADSLSWKDMFNGAKEREPEDRMKKKVDGSNAARDTLQKMENSGEEGLGEAPAGEITKNPELRHALYIAMAHGGLILLVAAVYGVGKLLEEYWTPIQWAILCSMPLREIQGALVEFWTPPLKLGLFETALALPVAVYDAIAGTLNDLRFAVTKAWPQGDQFHGEERPVGFSKLLRWLVSFAFIVLTYDRLGVAAWPLYLLAGLILYAAERTVELPEGGESNPGKKDVATLLRAISQVRRGYSRRKSDSRLPILSRANRGATRWFLRRLPTLIAVWLITMMIVGFFAGILLFSYKIGLESKDAVISIKEHVQKSNYAERVGLKQWINDNNISELMDTYTVKFYETVSLQVDAVARQYNMTEFADSLKNYLLKTKPADEISLSSVPAVPHPVTQKLHNIRMKVQSRDFRAIYGEIEGLFRDLKISREVLVERTKGFAAQGLDVFKRIYASSATVLTGGTNFLLSVVLSIASGAVGVLNFVSQSMVFFSLLYYLITSESGGVMDHVLGMLPVSKTARSRCAKVLDHAVSSVLLATAKMVFFQTAVTWLLFSFFQIHFVYMSTLLAFISALLPIFPTWVSSLPAGLQMALEGQYLQGIVLTIIHNWVMDYGVTAIQGDVPGQNAYLTGLSIIGGMAVFSPALEGAIMGPLIVTFMMALKNLYSEFVLGAAKEMDS